MSRTGFLIISAVVLALAAAGVLYWTNAQQQSSVSTPLPTQSIESKLVAQMSDIAAGNGIAATFSDADAKKWQVGSGHRLERFTSDDGKNVVARLTSSAPIDYASFDWPTQGLSITLPVEFAALVNGKRIEVGFAARMPGANASEAVSVIYATQQAGNSTWQQVPLGPAFTLGRFTFDVPPVAEGYSKNPIIVFHSDSAGSGKAVELLGVYVKVVAN
jgi:CTP:molybdopterin cytidylyltransferase MocA